MSWFKVLLTQGQLETEELQSLQERFQKLWLASGSPKEMALFSEAWPTSAGRPSVYFSAGCLPVAESLIAYYSGTSCERPRKDIVLLVGHANAWDLLE